MSITKALSKQINTIGDKLINRYYKSILLIVLSVISASSLAKNNPVLNWGYVDFSPYHYSKNGKVIGTQVERVQQIFNNIGIDYAPFELPVKRAKLYIDQGKVDFSTVIESFISTPDNFLRSERSFYNIVMGAICKEPNNQISDIESLKNLQLILIAGYTYGGKRVLDADNGFSIALQALNHEHAIKALTFNRGDCVLGYQAPFLAEKDKYPDTTFYFHEINTLPVFLFLNKQVSNAEYIMQAINDFNM